MQPPCAASTIFRTLQLTAESGSHVRPTGGDLRLLVCRRRRCSFSLQGSVLFYTPTTESLESAYRHRRRRWRSPKFARAAYSERGETEERL